MTAAEPNVIDMDAGPFEPACEVCGSDLWWEPCDQCGGEGYRELYEDDPLWYDEDDTETCDWCQGAGGHYFCLNASNHAAQAQLVLPLSFAEPTR